MELEQLIELSAQRIVLPNNWHERDYQRPIWDYFRDGGKRAIAVWHRRAGKDDVALHLAACEMYKRIGNVWHCLPEYAQGRKAIWTAINPHTGKRRIDEAFPVELRATTNDNEMFLRMTNGSTWQIIGSDRYDSTVGSSPAGIVYSEWALANPSAWAYHRPILEENDGWALFITTPRGRNHAHAMFNHAKQASEWFAELLTVDDTDAMSDAQLANALKELQAIYGADAGEAFFKQEFYCDFASALLGAFYAREMSDVRRENRIQPIEPIPGRPVHRAWDLGVADDTSIWWFQNSGGQLLILDHLVASGVGVEWYRDEIFRRHKERGWIHGTDYVPHDAKVKEFGTGRTRVETMLLLGLKPMLVPLSTIADGIGAVRRTLPLCVFDPRCEDGGVSALEQYRREWDDDKKAFKASPLHDWSSNPADSFRYLSMAWKTAPLIIAPEPRLEGWHIPPPPEPKRRGGIQL